MISLNLVVDTFEAMICLIIIEMEGIKGKTNSQYKSEIKSLLITQIWLSKFFLLFLAALDVLPCIIFFFMCVSIIFCYWCSVKKVSCYLSQSKQAQSVGPQPVWVSNSISWKLLSKSNKDGALLVLFDTKMFSERLGFFYHRIMLHFYGMQLSPLTYWLY